MLGTQTRWPSGSSGSRGIKIVHGQCYSEESLSAAHKNGKKKGLGVGSVGCDDGRSYANILAGASAISSTTPFGCVVFILSSACASSIASEMLASSVTFWVGCYHKPCAVSDKLEDQAS